MLNLCKVNGDMALALIADSWLARGWGLRHLWIGYSGSGKTVANCHLSEYLKKHGIVTVAVDQKAKVTRYDNVVADTVDDLPSIEGRSCCVRGFAAKNRLEDRVDFDKLARYIWQLGSSCRVALVVDELTDAQKAEKYFAAPKGQFPWMQVLYRQGREKGISVCAGTQLPQEIPRCAYSLSDSIGFFRQEHHEAAYYERLSILSQYDISTLLSLNANEFLLWRRGDTERYRCKFQL